MKEKLNNLIMETMKSRDLVRVDSLRAIKAAFMNWETSRDNVGKILDEATEISIMKKLCAQREESAKMYAEGGRQDLADTELAQLEVIKQFLPAPVTEQEIQTWLEYEILSIEPIKKNMGLLVKNCKAVYPGADGKMISQVVMRNLK